MNFMVMISKICQENFLNYKLGERLANLLNYSLDVFTSKRGLKLQIKNMKDYGFDPKFILISLVSTYLAFLDYPEFVELIVKDERSYKIENFEKVKSICSRGKINLPYEESEKFDRLVNIIKEKELELKSKTVNYDDAPEEFFDPITTLLMEDPVLLPSSSVIVDRNTIETHLLSDPTDPFNRSKLTKDMLINQDDLKARVLEYKKSKQVN
jgi:ubiquitin conjugation factor E4 B